MNLLQSISNNNVVQDNKTSAKILDFDIRFMPSGNITISEEMVKRYGFMSTRGLDVFYLGEEHEENEGLYGIVVEHSDEIKTAKPSFFGFQRTIKTDDDGNEITRNVQTNKSLTNYISQVFDLDPNWKYFSVKLEACLDDNDVQYTVNDLRVDQPRQSKETLKRNIEGGFKLYKIVADDVRVASVKGDSTEETEETQQLENIVTQSDAIEEPVQAVISHETVLDDLI